MSEHYDPQSIEQRWQQHWSDDGTYEVDNDDPRAPFYVLSMYPYPSGPAHMGHVRNYTMGDLLVRYRTMRGDGVLSPIGFDSFGLPAENAAIKTGTHPRINTDANVEALSASLRRIGAVYDWRREFRSHDPDYIRWTQWIFLKFYEAGLVYRGEAPVNWCPGCKTVLANEQVLPDGTCERSGDLVDRRDMEQWFYRITAYAQELLDGLDDLDWPEKVKIMQRHWIGRSEGVQFGLSIADGEGRPRTDTEPLAVYTTRPDTLFGATYMVLAPEHDLVDDLAAQTWPDGVDARWTFGAATPAEAVAAYRAAIAAKSDLERQENKTKTGVFLGAYAVNPANGQQVPVFIADYVLAGYGTGAIMAVPSGDQRDWDFATEFGLPIVEVVSGGDVTEAAYTGDGELVNSGFLDGMTVGQAKAAITDKLAADGRGWARVEYKLRDWLFARQRYWGEPFPIVYDADGRAHPLPESLLPVELPDVPDYSPVLFDPDDAGSEPSPPLAKATGWVNVELDLGDGVQKYTRDTNVMPQWAGSSWYQLRYVDPTNTETFVDPENEKYWVGPRPEIHGPNDPGGVDLYVGGQEHAVLHLMYARFWHKVLFDLGHVSSSEPYRRLYNQGYIQAYAFTDARGVYVPAEVVEERDGSWFYQGEPVNREYGKMGKSLKNSVSPDEIFAEYGADTLRVYEMSMGPLDTSRPWATKDVVGAQRFLQRVWRLVLDEETGEIRVTDAKPTEETLRVLNRAIDGVEADYIALRDNTAGAKLIELTNHLTKEYPDGAPRGVVEPLVLMLAPMAPHLCEELWSRLGHDRSLAHGPFPRVDAKWLVADTVDYPIQVNGKVRSRITVPADSSVGEVEKTALADEKITALLDGKAPTKVIVIPGRMVNIVLK